MRTQAKRAVSAVVGSCIAGRVVACAVLVWGTVAGAGRDGLAEEPSARPRLPRDKLLVYRGPDGAPREARTTDEWGKRRAEILDGMQQVMGRLPGREKLVPLDVKVEEEVDCGGYGRRLITYASEPGSRVPAYLLIPKRALEKDAKPIPAVLCLHGTDNVVGHGTVVGLGKRPNRQYASELAERGYVTLAPNYPLLAKYQPDIKALGWESGTLKAVWDNMRGLDLLESLPYVKRGGFGAIGPTRWAVTTQFTRASLTIGSARSYRVAGWIRTWTTTAARSTTGIRKRVGVRHATC